MNSQNIISVIKPITIENRRRIEISLQAPEQYFNRFVEKENDVCGWIEVCDNQLIQIHFYYKFKSQEARITAEYYALKLFQAFKENKIAYSDINEHKF